MIPVYIDLTAKQAYAVVNGADSFELKELPDIKPGSVLWLREPWRVFSDSMGGGLTTCSYSYKADYSDDFLLSITDPWKPADMMPPSAIRLRRRCTLVKRVTIVGWRRVPDVWYVGIGPLEDEK